MNSKISIIVPIYNAEHFLAETIQSVIEQTYLNWELLLIDDGSTDQSSSICADFKSKDVRIQTYYKPNGGQASARNLGIKKSNGNWIAMLDADDLWHPTKLEKQIAVVNAHPQVEFCYTNTSTFKGTIDNEIANNNGFEYGLYSTGQLFQNIYSHNPISNSSVLVRKVLLEQSGFYDEHEKIRGSEDWDLLLRILKCNSHVFGIDEKLLYYRQHEDGIHNQSSRMLIGKILVYSKHESDQTLSKLLKLRQSRYVYRELINELWAENKTDLLKAEFAVFSKKDKYGIATLKQRLMIKILPLSVFMWISQKIIYRIAYRLEKLTYWLFLK